MKTRGLFLAFGILLLLGGLPFVMATAVFLADPSYGGPGIAAGSGVCSAILLVPAAFLFFLYGRASAEEKGLRTVGAVLGSVREISIRDLAATLRKTPAGVRPGRPRPAGGPVRVGRLRAPVRRAAPAEGEAVLPEVRERDRESPGPGEVGVPALRERPVGTRADPDPGWAAARAAAVPGPYL